MCVNLYQDMVGPLFYRNCSFLMYMCDKVQTSCCRLVRIFVIFMNDDELHPLTRFFPCLGPGMLCHRSVGPLCAASSWRVWRRYRSGQFPEIWGSSLLRWSPRCLLCCERQPDPDDAWQNGWSHQVRHSSVRITWREVQYTL